MTRGILKLTLAVLVQAPFAGQSAEAKVGDRTWATCVWQKAPSSAAKWLAMPLPGSMADLGTPSMLLGHRLAATCNDAATNPANKVPNWKSLARALDGGRPKDPAPGDSPDVPVLTFCESRSESDQGVSHVFLKEIVTRSGTGESVLAQRYFTLHNAQSVPLPADLRVVPPAGAAIDRTCKGIGPEGELIDA